MKNRVLVTGSRDWPEEMVEELPEEIFARMRGIPHLSLWIVEYGK